MFFAKYTYICNKFLRVVKIELVDLEKFSGNKAHIYSVNIDGSKDTLFEEFVNEFGTEYSKDVKEILKNLLVMGNFSGCQENFFKLNEGKAGDGVAALWSNRIRAYCIRYGSSLIILGGGGYKPPGAKAYQEVEELNDKAELVKYLAKIINQRIKDRDLLLNEDGTIAGELTFEDYE